MGKRESLATVRAHRDALFTEAEKGRRRISELEAEVLKEQGTVRNLNRFIDMLMVRRGA